MCGTIPVRVFYFVFVVAPLLFAPRSYLAFLSILQQHQTRPESSLDLVTESIAFVVLYCA